MIGGLHQVVTIATITNLSFYSYAKIFWREIVTTTMFKN